jgi:hypothetical protein
MILSSALLSPRIVIHCRRVFHRAPAGRVSNPGGPEKFP